MAKRKKDTMEFRFYELPQGESALVLCGESWKRVYGHEEFHLHFHNLLEIGICREGDGNMYLDEDIYQYHDGDITFIPENFPHVTVSYGEVVNFWEYIFIDIRSVIEEMFPNNTAFQNEAVTTISKKAFMTNVYQSPAMAEYINAIIRETREHKIYCQRTVKLLVQGIVIELLRRYDELPEEDNNIVKGTNMSQIATALDYMNKHYSESIKAGELSELCNMSETHFRRLFESYINMPPMEYLNLIRVQKACELMKKTNEPMELIAQKCGFTTQSTFNRNFRKFLDTSPYQWKINPGFFQNDGFCLREKQDQHLTGKHQQGQAHHGADCHRQPQRHARGLADTNRVFHAAALGDHHRAAGADTVENAGDHPRQRRHQRHRRDAGFAVAADEGGDEHTDEHDGQTVQNVGKGQLENFPPRKHRTGQGTCEKVVKEFGYRMLFHEEMASAGFFVQSIA